MKLSETIPWGSRNLPNGDKLRSVYFSKTAGAEGNNSESLQSSSGLLVSLLQFLVAWSLPLCLCGLGGFPLCQQTCVWVGKHSWSWLWLFPVSSGCPDQRCGELQSFYGSLISRISPLNFWLVHDSPSLVPLPQASKAKNFPVPFLRGSPHWAYKGIAHKFAPSGNKTTAFPRNHDPKPPKFDEKTNQ